MSVYSKKIVADLKTEIAGTIIHYSSTGQNLKIVDDPDPHKREVMILDGSNRFFTLNTDSVAYIIVYRPLEPEYTFRGIEGDGIKINKGWAKQPGRFDPGDWRTYGDHDHISGYFVQNGDGSQEFKPRIAVGNSEPMQVKRLLTSADMHVIRGKAFAMVCTLAIIADMIFAHAGIRAVVGFFLVVGVGNIYSWWQSNTTTVDKK